MTVTELKVAGAAAVHNYQMQQLPRDSPLYLQQIQPGDIIVIVNSEKERGRIKK